MKPELVIFDMDGTILDTLEDLKESLNAALAANGFPKRTLEETRRFVGNGIAKLMERAVPVGTSPEVTAKSSCGGGADRSGFQQSGFCRADSGAGLLSGAV